jgi:nuclear pore complex protein Nup93
MKNAMTDENQDNIPLDDQAITEIIERITAFVKENNYEVGECKLEMIDDLPIYAIVYFLVRAGLRQEAVRVCRRMQLLIPLEGFFLQKDAEKVYNTALMQLDEISKNYSTDGVQIEEANFEFQKDIFKEALLILITKHPNNPSANLNSNLSDYLWFNLQRLYFDDLNLANRFYSQNSLTLKDLQVSILQHGDNYFNEDGTNPLNFYKVLILVGCYEEAILYLNKVGKNIIENTHVALVLDGLGLLKTSQKPQISKISKSGSKPEVPAFPKIINSFLQNYSPSLPA